MSEASKGLAGAEGNLDNDQAVSVFQKDWMAKMLANKMHLMSLSDEISSTSYGCGPGIDLPHPSSSLYISGIIGGADSPWSLGHPSSVHVLSTFDQHQCGSLDVNTPANVCADMIIADCVNDCVQRFSITATKYLEVPLHVVETDDPYRRSPTSVTQQPSYSPIGESVASAWERRWAEVSQKSELNDLKIKELKSRSERRKPVWVRCRLSTYNYQTYAGSSHTMVVEKPEIIIDNNEDCPFEYREAEIDSFTENGKDWRLTLIFPGVFDVIFRGFYGIAASDFTGASFASSATQITEITDDLKDTMLGEASSEDKNIIRDSFLKNGNQAHSKDQKNDIALHQIILKEDMRTASKIRDKRLGNVPFTRGIMPNQFSQPSACYFVADGSCLIVDNGINNIGSSPRIQLFQTGSSQVSKIIENRTLSTIASRKRFASSVNEDAERGDEEPNDFSPENLVVFRDDKGKQIIRKVPYFPIMLAYVHNLKFESADSNSDTNSCDSESDEETAICHTLGKRMRKQTVRGTPLLQPLPFSRATMPYLANFFLKHNASDDHIRLPDLTLTCKEVDQGGSVQTTERSRKMFLRGTTAKWSFMENPLWSRDKIGEAKCCMAIKVEISRHTELDSAISEKTETSLQKSSFCLRKSKKKETKFDSSCQVSKIEYVFHDNGTGYFEYSPFELEETGSKKNLELEETESKKKTDSKLCGVFFYSTDQIEFHFGPKVSIFERTESVEVQELLPPPSFPWYSSRVLISRNDMLPIKMQARFRIWDRTAFDSDLGSDNYMSKRCGRYAPGVVENAFNKSVAPRGEEALEKGYGYTPWFEVICFGFDPKSGFYTIELCNESTTISHPQRIDNGFSLDDTARWYDIIYSRSKNSYLSGFDCEYPYVNEFNLRNAPVEGQNLMCKPGGVSVTMPGVKRIPRKLYKERLASRLYLTDRELHTVHIFSNPLEGRENSNLKAKRSYESSYGCLGQNPGEFSSPAGIATFLGTDGKEHMLVADSGNNRVQCLIREENTWVVKCIYPDFSKHNVEWLLDSGSFDVESKSARGQANVPLALDDPLALQNPQDVSVQVLGSSTILVYVCDTGNNCIRVLTFETESFLKHQKLNKSDRSIHISSYRMLEEQHRRLFEIDSKNKELCYQMLPRTRLVCLATWGRYGNAPGFFRSPRSISSFIISTKRHVEHAAEKIASLNKHRVKIGIAIADSNRIQIMEHAVHINKDQDLNLGGKGCCSLQ